MVSYFLLFYAPNFLLWFPFCELAIGGNEARPHYMQYAICDASWSIGAYIISSIVGAPQQKRQQQQQHILESRRTCSFFSYSDSLPF